MRYSVLIISQTPQCKWVLEKWIDEVGTDNPENDYTVGNVMRSDKLTRREKWKLLRNRPAYMALGFKHEIKLVSTQPYTIMYSGNWLNITGFEENTFPQFAQKVKFELFKQGLKETDYLLERT